MILWNTIYTGTQFLCLPLNVRDNSFCLKNFSANWVRICERFRSPGNDYKESIPGLLKRLQIRTLSFYMKYAETACCLWRSNIWFGALEGKSAKLLMILFKCSICYCFYAVGKRILMFERILMFQEAALFTSIAELNFFCFYIGAWSACMLK